ncbi:MAG TPA: MFS transporter [Chitinolyticbacter sp.]|nr:MFS transporter [Chitinolyticbacter sp.]
MGSSARRDWTLVLLAASLLVMSQGARQSLGLFVFPLHHGTGLGIAAISLAMAIGQFTWGAVQPLAGAAADRWGAPRVLAAGLMLMALGTALTPFATTSWALDITLGVLSAAGAGLASFSVLIGALAQRLPAERRGMASGILNAGGSFGQFVFAPLTQGLITVLGWMGAMWGLALVAVAALPLVGLLRAPQSAGRASHVDAAPPGGLKRAVREALGDRSYLLLHAGFFTCGFHIAFLVTHLPGEVNLCGLPASVASWSLALIGLSNIVGSLAAGWWVQRYRGKYVLFWMYGSRALLVLAYLAAPKSAATFYLFAIGLGFTWLATVPPTAGVVGKLFGTRYLATLFGLTLLSHQIGGFLGAWLGGIALIQTGDYQWMWYANAALAAIAALCNLPIREPRIAKTLTVGEAA